MVSWVSVCMAKSSTFAFSSLNMLFMTQMPEAFYLKIIIKKYKLKNHFQIKKSEMDTEMRFFFHFFENITEFPWLEEEFKTLIICI